MKKFHEILFKLILIYIFSYLQKREVRLTGKFKEKTLKKILAIMLNKVEEIFGRNK